MSIAITCPQCENQLQVRDEHAGKRVKCPRCGAALDVPQQPATAAEAPPSLAPPAVATELPAVLPATGVRTKPPPLPEPAAAPERAEPRQRFQRCPECGARIPANARRCPECRADLDDEDEDDRPRRPRRAHKPCPRCGAAEPRKVSFTWWGSVYGPALFSHVRCVECGYGYNGRTGRSNLIPAIFFVAIPAILIVLIIAFLVFVVLASMGPGPKGARW
jgi:predicted Zn finger-like uncharacterized protein